MCCLKYEQDAYEDAVKRLPKNESFVETPDGAGTVCEVDFLRERVKVRLEEAPETPQGYAADELNIIRNGKGRRPEDYVAPPRSELEKLRRSTPKLIPAEKQDLSGDIDAVMGRSEAKPPRQGERRRGGDKQPGRKQADHSAQQQGGPSRRRHHRGGGKGKSGGAKSGE